jgi:hypothetical protein
MRRMEKPAAVLNAAVGAHLRHAHFYFQIEVLHAGAGPLIVNVVLAWRLCRIGVNCAVVDRPNVGLAVPSVERLAVPELRIAGVNVCAMSAYNPSVFGRFTRTSSSAMCFQLCIPPQQISPSAASRSP